MSISTYGFWGFSGGHLGRRDWFSWPLQVHRKRFWAQSCFKGPPENPQKWYAEINQFLHVVSGGFLGVTWAAASGFLSCLRSTRNAFWHKVIFICCHNSLPLLLTHAHTCQTYFTPGLHQSRTNASPNTGWGDLCVS